jgi:hypothetical protein
MLKKFAFPVLLTVLFLPLSAQVEEVSVGQSYANSTFFRIGDGTSTTVDPTTWDIAFSLAPEAAGAFVNEAVASSMGAPLPQVELYAPLDSDYDNLDTAGMIRIYNPDVTWSEGAFNALRDPQNDFDYGWGFYDEANDEIVGTKHESSRIFDNFPLILEPTPKSPPSRWRGLNHTRKLGSPLLQERGWG